MTETSNYPPPPPTPGWQQPALSPGDAKAQAKAARAYAKASRPWFKKKRVFVPLVLVAVIVLASVAGGDEDKPSDTKANASGTGVSSDSAPKANDNTALEHAEDAKIAKCGTDDLGFAEALVKITNSSSKPSDYFVTVAFESKDRKTQLGTGVAVVMALQPGQSASEGANSLKEAKTGSFTCRLQSVMRTAS
jgi:hypothetical protein